MISLAGNLGGGALKEEMQVFEFEEYDLILFSSSVRGETASTPMIYFAFKSQDYSQNDVIKLLQEGVSLHPIFKSVKQLSAIQDADQNAYMVDQLKQKTEEIQRILGSKFAQAQGEAAYRQWTSLQFI